LKLYLKMEELANKEAQLILFGSSPFEFAVHFNGRTNGTNRKYSIFIRQKANVVRPSVRLSVRRKQSLVLFLFQTYFI